MNKLAIITSGIASAGLLTISGLGVAMADTSSTATVGTSGIPRTVYRTERQTAASEVLNTSVANIQAAHQAHTMKQLVANAGLSRQTFHQKLKTQLTSDLEAKGYSAIQATQAEQHRHQVHVKHHAKAKSTTSARSQQ